MNKNRVLKITAILFAKYGIKSVSMDAIASHLNMSKKTLYELFEDKEDLVNQVLESEHGRIHDYSVQMEKRAESPLEKLIIQSVVYYSYIVGCCPAFYKDLKKFASACRTHEQRGSALVNEHKKILTEGIRQGFFSPDLHPDIILRLFQDQTDHVKIMFGQDRMSTGDFLLLLIAIFKGICTAKGLTDLEHIRTKWTEPAMLSQLTTLYRI